MPSQIETLNQTTKRRATDEIAYFSGQKFVATRKMSTLAVARVEQPRQSGVAHASSSCMVSSWSFQK